MGTAGTFSRLYVRLRLMLRRLHGARRVRIVLLCLLVIAVDTVILFTYIQKKRAAHIPPATTALGTRAVPSSTRPSASAVANYQVAPSLPKYLIIPGIQVNARIFSLSVDPHNQIQAPANIYDAGWYKASSLPGQSGAMFIDGHISSWTAHGVFYDLKRLKKGDVMQIVRGDNTTYTYIVQKTQVYDAAHVDMTQVLRSADATKPGLNLMTCAGSLIPGTSDFSQRLVVYGVMQ